VPQSQTLRNFKAENKELVKDPKNKWSMPTMREELKKTLTKEEYENLIKELDSSIAVSSKANSPREQINPMAQLQQEALDNLINENYTSLGLQNKQKRLEAQKKTSLQLKQIAQYQLSHGQMIDFSD